VRDENACIAHPTNRERGDDYANEDDALQNSILMSEERPHQEDARKGGRNCRAGSEVAVCTYDRVLPLVDDASSDSERHAERKQNGHYAKKDYRGRSNPSSGGANAVRNNWHGQ